MLEFCRLSVSPECCNLLFSCFFLHGKWACIAGLQAVPVSGRKVWFSKYCTVQSVLFFRSNYTTCSEWRMFPLDLDHCDYATIVESGLMRPKKTLSTVDYLLSIPLSLWVTWAYSTCDRQAGTNVLITESTRNRCQDRAVEFFFSVLIKFT